jgi:peptide/nickel transport system ATP-binding protein
MNENNAALQIDELSVAYEQNGACNPVLNNVSLHLGKGEILSLVGESGSGKSTIAKAIGGLLPPSAHITSGTMCLDTDFTVSLNSRADEWNRIRGKKLGFIFQDAQLALNPLMKIIDHFQETILFHHMAPREKVKETSAKYLEMLNFSDTESVLESYPFELSGGMCQRVCIALALCLEPPVLIADEPTSALDMISQKELLDLLYKIQKELDLSVLLITHDITVAQATSDRVVVLNRCSIVEEGSAREVFTDPKDIYTKQLLSSRMLYFQATESGKAFEEEPVLQAESLRKSYSAQKEVLKGISFDLHKTEILGFLGESGCGKTTLAKCMIGLEPISGGKLLLHGKNIAGLKGESKREKCRYLQMIFQDARASLNPRRSALQIVQEPLHYLGLAKKNEYDKLAKFYLDEVGICGDAQTRRPPQLSTGQCQRVAIARALIVKPDVLICDEAVSALDMTVQAQILQLLMQLHDEFQFSIIMITHDIRILRYFCHRIAVMQEGIFLEITEGGDKLNESNNPYTRLLLKNEQELSMHYRSSVA